MGSNGLTPVINCLLLISGATSAIVGSWLAMRVAQPKAISPKGYATRSL
ncbi:MAG: hypothetical protein F6K26_42270 [Moorea sp. SIO2I5]|nr:hypothetical protein [Moorena sp. SIO2I5]